MAASARLTVMWSTPQDPAEFDRHYQEVHIPLARKVPGLRRYTLSRNILQVRGDEPLYLVAELDFDDMSALREAFETPEGKAVTADSDILAQNTELRITVYELDDILNPAGSASS